MIGGYKIERTQNLKNGGISKVALDFEYLVDGVLAAIMEL